MDRMGRQLLELDDWSVIDISNDAPHRSRAPQLAFQRIAEALEGDAVREQVRSLDGTKLSS